MGMLPEEMAAAHQELQLGKTRPQIQRGVKKWMGNIGVESIGADDVITKVKFSTTPYNQKSTLHICVTMRVGMNLPRPSGFLHSQCRLLRSRGGPEWPDWDTAVLVNWVAHGGFFCPPNWAMTHSRWRQSLFTRPIIVTRNITKEKNNTKWGIVVEKTNT